MATIELDLKIATELFVAEFSVFEKHFVGMALCSVSGDPSFAGYAEKLLDLEGRLTLLKRIAIAQQIDSALISQLEDVQIRARHLREKRDELAQVLEFLAAVDRGSRLDRNPPFENENYISDAIVPRRHRTWVPTVGELDECRRGTNRLQTNLGSIAAQLSGYRELR
jgi:hypothetical protein